LFVVFFDRTRTAHLYGSGSIATMQCLITTRLLDIKLTYEMFVSWPLENTTGLLPTLMSSGIVSAELGLGTQIVVGHVGGCTV